MFCCLYCYLPEHRFIVPFYCFDQNRKLFNFIPSPYLLYIETASQYEPSFLSIFVIIQVTSQSQIRKVSSVRKPKKCNRYYLTSTICLSWKLFMDFIEIKSNFSSNVKSMAAITWSLTPFTRTWTFLHLENTSSRHCNVVNRF